MYFDITGSMTYCLYDAFFYSKTKIYIQTDGVKTSSLLGPTFSVYYMSELENKLLSKPLYHRWYVYDLLITSNGKMSTHSNRNKFTMTSRLDFTYEDAQDESFQFSDVKLTKTMEGNFTHLSTKNQLTTVSTPFWRPKVTLITRTPSSKHYWSELSITIQHATCATENW